MPPGSAAYGIQDLHYACFLFKVTAHLHIQSYRNGLPLSMMLMWTMVLYMVWSKVKLSLKSC